MARHCERDTTLIYEAAIMFRDRCLLSEGSLFFDDTKLWTAENLKALHQVFVGAPDESERSFDTKFRDQIEPAGQSVTRLAAEVVAVHFLFPSSIGGARKRQLVGDILSWHGNTIPEGHLVSRAFDIGIGSGGQGYNTRRRFELYFLIEFASAWKSLKPEEAADRLSDPWKFMAFVDEVEGGETAQLRHMLLHLLFPDSFERIASGDHKRRLGATFGELAGDAAQSLELDLKLYEVRKRLEKLLPDQALDFYWEPLREAWYDETEDAGGMVSLDAIHYKKQIVLYGPPGTGKTHQAKAIAEQLIRAAALEKWEAPRYFAEAEELEKALATHVRRLQLHPAYSYEDFIRGLHLIEGGRTEYRPGYLLELIAEMEKEDESKRLPYVLILDEINRTDLSRLLGECFSLLENRGETVELPGRSASGQAMKLRIPDDLYVIGTMNLIDQSIEQIDFALRRRFLWKECLFSAQELMRITGYLWEETATPYHSWERVREEFARLAAAAAALNEAICKSALLGSQYEIGHTYFFDAVHFLRLELRGAQRVRKHLLWRHNEPTKPLTDLWNLALRPLLREYLSGLDANTRQAEIAKLETVFLTKPEPLALE